MPLYELLNKLDKVKKTGASRYIACCPAHGDKNPSLTITETDASVVLIKCWAGCGASEILSAVGLEFSDLYPPRTDSHGNKPVKRPWNPYDVLKIMAFEATVCRVIVGDILQGKAISDEDLLRLDTAHSRLADAVVKVRG